MKSYEIRDGLTAVVLLDTVNHSKALITFGHLCVEAVLGPENYHEALLLLLEITDETKKCLTRFEHNRFAATPHRRDYDAADNG